MSEIEWLCKACNTIHPAPDGLNLVCPTCGKGTLQPSTLNERRLEHDIRSLLAALEKAEAERDAAYRTIADAVANNIGHETSIRRAEWVSKHSAVIEAARKMGYE